MAPVPLTMGAPDADSQGATYSLWVIIAPEVPQEVGSHLPDPQHPPAWKLALYCSQADNKGADADPHASRYCDGDPNVATLAGKRPHLSVNGKAEP
jgi:hypothetical protein